MTGAVSLPEDRDMGPLVHRPMSPTARNIRDLIRQDDHIDLSPPYQRGDVWSTEQRVNLIRSMLLGVPVAAIVLNQRGDNRGWAANERDPNPPYWYACIDGKQRLTTMALWFGGELAVPSRWFAAEYLPDNPPEWVTYDGLSAVGQRLLSNRLLLPVAEARLSSLAEEAEVYGLINAAGTAQSTEDLARAREVARG